MKMPSPTPLGYDSQGDLIEGFTEAQMKQALIDLLEAAAVECDQERAAHLMFKNYQAAMALTDVADSIRSMKEKL